MTRSVDASVVFDLAATCKYHACEDSKAQNGNHSTRVRMCSANVRYIRSWCVIRHGERFGVRLELKGEIRRRGLMRRDARGPIILTLTQKEGLSDASNCQNSVHWKGKGE